MKNRLGAQFYFFQARRGGQTRSGPHSPKHRCELVPVSHIVFPDFSAAKAQMARTGRQFAY
jgi:hypothetical protein